MLLGSHALVVALQFQLLRVLYAGRCLPPLPFYQSNFNASQRLCINALILLGFYKAVLGQEWRQGSIVVHFLHHYRAAPLCDLQQNGGLSLTIQYWRGLPAVAAGVE
jgi:hypothetical protein